MPEYYPVFLNLTGKLCVIIGGGYVAEGKISRLTQSGARIKLISPTATPSIREADAKGELEWQQREYRSGDLEGAFIAIAATNQPLVNQQIFQEAERSGVMLNAVDDTPRCTFIAPSIVTRGPVTLAISTGGVSPALARKLRETLTDASTLDWVDLAPVLAKARQEVKQLGAVVEPDHWQDCITAQLLELTQSGQEEEALDRLLSQLLVQVEPSTKQEESPAEMDLLEMPEPVL